MSVYIMLYFVVQKNSYPNEYFFHKHLLKHPDLSLGRVISQEMRFQLIKNQHSSSIGPFPIVQNIVFVFSNLYGTVSQPAREKILKFGERVINFHSVLLPHKYSNFLKKCLCGMEGKKIKFQILSIPVLLSGVVFKVVQLYNNIIITVFEFYATKTQLVIISKQY